MFKYKAFVWVVCVMTMGISAGISNASTGIKISETAEAEVRLFHIENDLYHAVFLPGHAMFPLYYTYKPSGKDVLVRKADVAKSIRSRDGIQLCLPWVGVSKRSQQSKGLLRGADWEISTVSEPARVVLNAETTINYEDPVSFIPAKLDFSIQVTGVAGSSRIKMDYEIFNTGTNQANFMFVAHGRLAPDGEYKHGDYIFAPSEKCWISDFQWPVLSNAGVTPQSWTKWPVPGMDEFTVKPPEEKHRDFAYAFVPAPWLITGNNDSKNFVFFHSSPINIGKKVQEHPFFCVLRRDDDYLVEIGVSRELTVKYWENAGAVVTLAPEEKLSFTIHMAAGSGLTKADAALITDAQPDRIVFESEKNGKKTIIF